MKNTCFLLILITLFLTCKQNSDSKKEINQMENVVSASKIYPEKISKVFDAHGGLELWKRLKSLEFTMQKPDGDEVTTTDLINRKSFIDMPNNSIGYNGKDVWLLNKDTTAYKGKPKFYYNLMFYFYAMPFVLADDGITYRDAEPLVFEGKTYPGIKISYQAGVGESSEDEYILYFDAETHQMEWLAYTVTFFTKEKGEKFNYMKYSHWQIVDGLLLPEILTWYHVENNLPTSKRNDVMFSNVNLSKEKPNPEIFEMPEGAEIIQ